MVGNLEEWVLSGWQGRGGALEGGAWFTFRNYADCTGRYSRQPNYRFNPEIEIFSSGFRCCWSARAPREEDLEADDLMRDTRSQLEAARRIASRAAYAATDEVQVLAGLWMDRHEYPNQSGEYPLVGVTWSQAARRCKAAGKRLCSTSEWIRACGGEQGRSLPYGDNVRPKVCAVALGGPAASGSYPDCKSESGILDLVGGVWEWTSTKVETPPAIYPKGTMLRQVVGGGWFNALGDARCQGAEGYAVASQEQAFPDLGFRCCRGRWEPKTAASALANNDRCPDGMVLVGVACIDAHEHPNRSGEVPASGLDLAAARQGCTSRGLRLCTAQEWELACSGKGGLRPWPYGDSYEVVRCNHGQGKADAAPGPLASGLRPLCVTVDGVYDLSGNVWEWVDLGGGKGELRGGGINVSAGFGRCTSRASSAPKYSSPETGTRCCTLARALVQ